MSTPHKKGRNRDTLEKAADILARLFTMQIEEMLTPPKRKVNEDKKPK
jgi:hypothetical protein